MKIINHEADNERRQVVPADFSFLSDADQEVVGVFHAAMCALFGITPNTALAIGCQFEGINVGDHWEYGLGAGTLIYKGKFYELSSVPRIRTEQQLNGVQMMALVNRYYVQFGSTAVSPSPVFKYGEGTVSCHENSVVVGYTDQIPERDALKLADIRMIPKLGDAVGVYGVTLVQGGNE